MRRYGAWRPCVPELGWPGGHRTSAVQCRKLVLYLLRVPATSEHTGFKGGLFHAALGVVLVLEAF